MKKLIDSQQYRQALAIFDRQLSIGDQITFTLALKACTKLNDYQYGIRIHQQLSLKAIEDPYLQTSLIHFYMQCHNIDQADKIFSTMKNKTVYAYGAMFKGYISNNMPEKVLELFEKISIKIDELIIILLFNACAKLCNNRAIKTGRDALNRLPTSFLQNQKLINAAIDILMKFGDVNQAEVVFETTQNKTLVTYGAMMQGYVTNDLSDKALDLFEKNPLKSNEVLYAIVYNACASLSNEKVIQLGKKIFDEMPKRYLHDNVLVNSIIHMFMSFGEIEIAENLFSDIKDKTSYTYGAMINEEPIFLSLIGACSQIGIRSICEHIVRQIPLSQPSIYLQNALIDMWGKSGDVNQAKQIFQSIAQPEIISYNSMINVYARNGMGYEAIDLYNKIDENIRDKISHICVLNACSHSGLIDQAQMIFNKIEKKSVEIITTMIDCLSRMAMFDQAQKLIDDHEKSNSPNSIMYTAMLSGARNHRHVVLSEKLYNQMKSLFSNEKSDLISASTLLSNTYSSLENY
ncbi:unnamed protein product [Rotaria magnacalcarata]